MKKTTIDDFLRGLSVYGCINKARAYERELHHYREHGELPPDAQYIKRVYHVNGQELVEVVMDEVSA